MLGPKLYYGVKPMVPYYLRRAVRRLFASRKRRQAHDVWPILQGSERQPPGWPGWPDGKKFAFVLTHDVEGQNGVDRCRQLMEVDKKWGFRSSFNFIPEGKYRVSKEMRDELTENGFEVGVHDLRHDGKLYQGRNGFDASATRINSYLKEWGAVGFRSGFMFHNLEWLHDLEIQYDASTFDTDPFEPQPDGVGTIFPFLKRSTNGHSYVELPYTLPQDSTLFLLFDERSPEIWLRKLDWIAEHGGMALLNVHPDYVRFPGESSNCWNYKVELYEGFLRQVSERYANLYWAALPREVAAWHKRSTPAAPSPTLQPSRAASSLMGLPQTSAPPKRLSGRAVVAVYSHYESDARPIREAEALVKAGMQVDVVCLRLNKNQAANEVLNGVNVHRVPFSHRRGNKSGYVIRYVSFFLSALFRLTLWSMRGNVKLAHIHNMPNFLVFSALVPRLTGAKVILDLHDPMPEVYGCIFPSPEKQFTYRVLLGSERRSIDFADKALTPNIAFKRLFDSRSNRVADKVEIVMNSPDQDIFDSEKFRPAIVDREKPFTIMYHGLLVERHGLDLAVRAVGSLKDRIPRIKFDIYGEHTEYLDAVLSLVRELGLENTVQYHGFRPLDEVPSLISSIDIGLVPNRLNSFTSINLPTRIFEYLAMDKPVIVPRTPGIRDYFTDDNMIFFDPGDIKDLAGKIEWAWSHPTELRSITEKGREVYWRNSWLKEKDRFIDIVDSLLNDTRTKAVPSRSAEGKMADTTSFSQNGATNGDLRAADEDTRVVAQISGRSELFRASAGKPKPKIWIDLDNTPHVVFFEPILDELRSRGYPLLVTARDAFQVCELADRKKIPYTLVGRHYGKNRIFKVAGLLIRSLQLAPFALREKPALSISHGARSQLIVCNALGIPSLLLADYEYAKYPPLMRPTWEMVPSVIPDDMLCRDHQHVLRYPGIKEDTYVWKFQPDHGILQELGLSQSDVIITVRPPASEAHYHNPESDRLFTNFMEYACGFPQTRIILLPRNHRQGEHIRGHWPHWFKNNKTVVPAAVVDGLNLIWHSDLLVSGGGTMNREATALGVPVYSIFLGAIGAVDRHLQQTGRLILIKSEADFSTKIRLEKRPPPPHSIGQPTETFRHIVRTIESLVGGGPDLESLSLSRSESVITS
jgi:hypothetical protein